MAASPSRRALVATTAALVACLQPAKSQPVDPVFAAIALAVAADDALTDALADLDESDTVAMGLADAAADRSSDAIRALAETVPTTAAGLRALIRHYAADTARQDTYSVGAVCLAHLARIVEAQPPPD